MKNFIAVVFLVYGSVYGLTLAAGLSGPHGGQMIQNQGIDYELVNNVREHKIQIYAPPRAGSDLPSSLSVKVKKNDTLFEHIHLTLSPGVEPNTPSYSALVPASISISGGITFEIEF